MRSLTPGAVDRPSGKIDIPSAWLGAEMKAKPERWLISLTAGEIAELEHAARYRILVEAKRSPTSRRTVFRFRASVRIWNSSRTTLLVGQGFEVIRGLPVEKYSQAFAATIFCGVGAHLGARGPRMPRAIFSAMSVTSAPTRRIRTRGSIRRRKRQTFHTDSSDVVGLLCIREAMEGGDSLLVSTSTIYNEMFDRRPDLAALLFDPIGTDRRGEVPENEKPYLEIPVLNWHAGFLTGFYQRQYIDSAQRFPDALRLTPDRVAALDLFDTLANDPKLNFGMRLRPGDMQFVYNHALLHDRTGFRDWPDRRRRHLLRLWLILR